MTRRNPVLRSLRFADWPSRDKQLWAASLEMGGVLDGGGLASHWAPATRSTNMEHYATWLGFAGTRHGMLATAPGKRVTKELVHDYIELLKTGIAPRTVVSRLVGLKVVLKAIAPEYDWRWLVDICNRLNRSAEPLPSQKKVIDSEELYRRSLDRLRKLRRADFTRRIPIVEFRDFLIIALISACPLRLRNLAELEIDRTISRSSQGWLIHIPREETKNRQVTDFAVPQSLTPLLDLYTSKVRPQMVRTGTTQFLWVNWSGRPLKPHSIYCRIVYRTEIEFRRPLNPHFFRKCAATTLAVRSTDDGALARGILGHHSLKTTEKYYIQAQQLEISREVNELLLALSNE